MLASSELIALVKSYDPEANADMLKKAYIFAMEAHGLQKRASGAPYFYHPAEVARILAELHMDVPTVVTGLLHDVLEDTNVSFEELEEIFGSEIAFLVEGVTKLSKINYTSAHARHAENFQKFILAVARDIRVLLVKLVDRLHNMRTLNYIEDPEKRRRISLETLNVYAPLAERIGLSIVRKEIEDIAFYNLHPNEYSIIAMKLEKIRNEDSDFIENTIAELNNILREEIAALLTENNTVDTEDFTLPAGKKPYVIMVVGVNGVGKTTTIGKLAYQFKKAGNSVYLGAADTFRAAAVEQLDIWGERVGVPVIKQKMGADPASVAFDTLSSAVANNADVVIIDTAGRLHNKVGLMNELTKIKNVMKKVVPDAPHEVLLVLDGSTGQNAFEQAKQFTLATEVNAMAITKLDGTAKGGVVIGISDQFKIPVKYIGLGEGIEDLQVFRRREFVDSLFGAEEK